MSVRAKLMSDCAMAGNKEVKANPVWFGLKSSHLWPARASNTQFHPIWIGFEGLPHTLAQPSLKQFFGNCPSNYAILAAINYLRI